MPSSDRHSTRLWIEAGILLAADPGASVNCPVCADGILIVRDVAWPDGYHLDRHIQCPKCGARNVLSKLKMCRFG